MSQSLLVDDRPGEFPIYETDNPRSVVNIVTPKLRECIGNIPEDMRSMTDKELEEMAWRGKFTPLDHQLRTSFWIEYSRAQDVGKPMKLSLVWGTICTEKYFYEKFITDKVRMAYMLLPPANYSICTEEMLTLGLKKMREILDMPLYKMQADGVTPDLGKPDPKVADVILKAYTLIDMRRNGAVIQRVEQKNLNVNVNAKSTQTQPTTVEDLDRELKQYEEKSKQAYTIVADIEVKGTPVDE